MRYKKKNLKIVVVPHYSGSVKTTEVFRKVIAEQIEKKLNKSEKKNNDGKDKETDSETETAKSE